MDVPHVRRYIVVIVDVPLVLGKREACCGSFWGRAHERERGTVDGATLDLVFVVYFLGYSRGDETLPLCAVSLFPVS